MTNEVNTQMENDILGFDPTQLAIFNDDNGGGSNFDNNIYHPKPAESKSEDSIYRAQIKIIYNPWDLKHSILEQQSYALQDANGFFTVVSSLTNGNKECPVFKAWKQCRYSEDPKLTIQSTGKDKGGRGLFDKRYGRYVTIQVIEDNNHPELNGRYMFWKMPKAIWDMINSKMAPSPESKRPSIPIMDFLFGRAIDLEVTPGPDDPQHPERKTREISYSTSEITDDVVSCTNPDGSSLLTDEQQEILDTYVDRMTKLVWKQKDPAKRAEAIVEINSDENTIKLRALYKDVIEKIKSFCPNVTEELGYKEWTPEVKARVNAWINIVLTGADPAKSVATISTTTDVAPATAPVATPEPTMNGDDLPF